MDYFHEGNDPKLLTLTLPVRKVRAHTHNTTDIGRPGVRTQVSSFPSPAPLVISGPSQGHTLKRPLGRTLGDQVVSEGA